MRPRIRTIKPEFFQDEGLWDLAAESGLPVHLAFAGLWCFADREGRFEWRPRALKAGILPYWDGDFSRVLDALAGGGFLVRYAVDGRDYGLVHTFAEHQVINQRESKSVLPAPNEGSANACARPVSANVPGPVRDLVFSRDGNRCRRCPATEDLTIDHIFPRALGGTHAIENLRTLCRSCNSARPVAGNALLDDLAKDGLALADMQRTCAHVHAHGEGKGTEGSGKGTEGSGSVARTQPLEPEPPSSPEVTQVRVIGSGGVARTYTMPSQEPPAAYLEEATMRGVHAAQAKSTWKHYYGAGLPERGVERLHDWLLQQAAEKATRSARAGPRRSGSAQQDHGVDPLSFHRGPKL